MATRQILLILGIVLLLRLPFLTQPIQGDDPYYLFGAQHGLIDPMHPSHARYLFQGDSVDMRGHPHPPLNLWILSGLIAAFGDVYEVPFHAAYILFSVISALSMWSLAKRFSEWPLGATLLFLSAPAFVVNGNSFEADLPFLAFWMAGMAFFVAGRFALSGLALTLAAMTAYQAIVATPILFVYCWLYARRSRMAWIVAFTPVLVVAAYQAVERVTSGTLPATVLAGYFSSYGLQQLTNKLKNAAALTAHTGWLVFPILAGLAFRRRWIAGLIAAIVGLLIDPNPLFAISFGVGALIIVASLTPIDGFLKAWIAIFFAAALVIFFAGSARYLLPMVAPVAILATRERRWVIPAFAANLLLGLGLAWVNFQHWDGYRQFAMSIKKELAERRVWTTSELGLRFYLESEGALPLPRTQPIRPGEWIVSTALTSPFTVRTPATLVMQREITATLPLRLLALNSKSGYSTATNGLRPFDISTGPIDRVRVDVVLERRPVLSYLPMNAPEAENQILSGLYQLEGQSRWTSGRAIFLLKTPPTPMPLQLKIFIHQSAPARKISVGIDGALIHKQTLADPGLYTITTRPASGSAVSLSVDKTFAVPGDSRTLGVMLIEAGFVPSQ